MPYWQCFYHMVWATKGRAAIITDRLEPVIHDVINGKSAEMGCFMLGINGMPDHVHIAVRIPPKVSVAEWVRNVKGASAFEINGQYPDLSERFQWQQSYGVVTFGLKNQPIVLDYIARQKEHHACNTLYAYLERTDD